MYWSPIRKLIGIPPKKTTPGHEFAGVVEAVGQRVTHFKVGDPVFGTTTGLAAGGFRSSAT
jgi:NADPH:quinone reductase-like Zn-dependent oxidoreductase